MRQKILLLILLFIILTGTALSISGTVTVLGQNSTMISGENNSSLNKKIVLGYYSLYTESDWQNIKFDNLSTMALHNIVPTSKGDFREDYDSFIPDQLIEHAHNSNVTVIISLGLGDAKIIDSILGNNSSQYNIITNMLGIMQRHNFDGIDIDFEAVNPVNSITGTSNKILMINFVKVLRNRLNTINPNYKIHMAIGSYYQDEDKIYDLTILQNYVDYIMIMGYDYNIGPIAGSNSPIDSYGEAPSIRDSLNHYSGLMNKNKILLGVPWFGYERQTETGNLLSPAIDEGNSSNYSEMKNSSVEYGRIWDNIWKTPWYKYRTNDSTWYQGHYDDIESLGIKYDLVNSQNLAGIGIWQLEYGDKVPELWQLINDKFGK